MYHYASLVFIGSIPSILTQVKVAFGYQTILMEMIILHLWKQIKLAFHLCDMYSHKRHRCPYKIVQILDSKLVAIQWFHVELILDSLVQFKVCEIWNLCIHTWIPLSARERSMLHTFGFVSDLTKFSLKVNFLTCNSSFISWFMMQWLW